MPFQVKPNGPVASDTHSDVPAAEQSPTLSAWLRWGLTACAAMLTVAVFGLYQRPDFLMTLADQLWACF